MNQGQGDVGGASFKAIVTLTIAAWCGLAVAEVTPEAEYGNYVAKGNTIQPLGDSPFGESINLYDGAISFSQADVEVPGIGPTIRLVRSLRVREAGKTYENIGMGFYDWNLEIPRVKTITAVHYGGYPNEPHDWYLGAVAGYARCSQFGPPPTLSYVNDPSASWEPDEWWDGYYLVGGDGDSQLLLSQNYGAAYPLGTKSNWRVGCLSSTANGQPGEAFLGVAPDGTRYWFNHLVYTYAEPLIKDPRQLDRRYAAMLVTRIEDRFGNWLVYNYSGDKLTSISASDGRHVTIAYADTYSIGSITVDTVDTPSRTWTYQGANWVLNAVINPDASRWNFSLATLSHAPEISLSSSDCHSDPVAGLSTISGSITTPSGLTGTFSLEGRKHGRSYTYKQCWGNDEFNTYAWFPKLWYSYTLTSRVLTGPGLQPKSWNYAYSPANDSWLQDCPTPTSCPSTIWTDVTNPEGTRERHSFSNKSDHTEALLLKTEVFPQGSASPIRVVNNTYAVAAPSTSGWPFPWPEGVGESYANRDNDYVAARWSPLSRREIQQDGVTFAWQANSFDNLARPLSVTRSSNISYGYNRTDVTAYHDNLSQWVLGQVASSTNSYTGLVESQTDYDANALPWKTYAFGKLQQTLTYHANGTMATVKDGKNNTTTFSQWKRGIPQLIGFADGTAKAAVVNDHGWIASVTDENGFQTKYGYDAMGRVNLIDYPDNDSVNWNNEPVNWNSTVRSFEQINVAEFGLPAGHWRQSVSTGNARQYTYYDALWRPVVTESYDTADYNNTLSQTLTRYDANGRVAYTSYPVRGASSYLQAHPGTYRYYDALDRPTLIQQDSELGTLSTTTEYLAGGETRVTNPRGLQTRTRYAAWDQPSTDYPIEVFQPEGVFTQIWRDHFFKPTRVRRSGSYAGQSVEANRYYVYNAQQRLCKRIEPESGATAMDYDAADNLAWSTSGLSLPDTNACNATEAYNSARRVDRTYDVRNRLSQLIFSDGNGNQTWSYTPDGLPLAVTTWNDNGTSTATNDYVYNKRRLLTGEHVGQPGWYNWGIGYRYDANGSLSAQQYPTGLLVTYAPNALGQATQAGSYATGVQYHPNGAIKQFSYGNGLTHTMTQNGRQLPVRVTDSNNALDHEYAYDGTGNVAHILDHMVGVPPQHRWLQYDGLDRLTQAASSLFGGTDLTIDYAYDALDNLRKVDHDGVRNHTYWYDANNRLTNVKDASQASVIGLGYDVQGNLNNKNGQAYGFDYGNRLRVVTGQQGLYRYDAHGRRVMYWRPANGGSNTLSQYSQAGQLLYEESGSRQRASELIYLGGSLVATRERNWSTNQTQTRYQHTDALGSPTAISDATGAVVERTYYMPYGAAINKTIDGVGYTGHVMDSATGLTYMQQRYYDPVIGRFLSMDPVTADANTGGNFNRYWYANNNPYKFTDPDGRIVKISSENTKSDKKKIADAIDKLLETKSGAEAFKKLNDSKNIFIIKKDGSRIRTQASDQSKAEKKESVGATIFFDPDKKTGGKDSTGSTKRPGYVDLAHEFGHAVALDNGTQSFDKGIFKEGTTPPSEVQSMELENAVRQEHGLPLRPSYYFK